MDLQDLLTMEQGEVEKYLAGNLFLNPIDTLQDCNWLEPEVMINSEIKSLWKQSRDKINFEMSGEQAQEVVTQVALELGIAIELMRDATHLYGFMDRPSAYAQEIMNRARNRKLSAALPELVRALADNRHDRVDAFVDNLGNMKRVCSGKVRSVADIHDAFVTYIDSTSSRAVETFIQGIDEGLGGLVKQNLIVLGARPSQGKTAIAWQIARDVAYGGEKAAFFSCEMSEIDLWLRAACFPAGVSWRDVVSKRLTPAQKQALKEESELLRELLGERMMVDDRPQTTGTIWQYVSTHRPALVVVDHLRLLNDQHENENKRLGIITKNLKDMSKAFDCAVLCLAQLNRKVEDQSNKKPGMKDLRDSGEIEENADVVLFIYSPDFYEEDKVKDNIRGVQLWAEKNRNGQRAIKINLAYNLHEQRFYPANVTTTNLSKI